MSVVEDCWKLSRARKFHTGIDVKGTIYVFGGLDKDYVV
jgi:hypothetical protein